MRSARYCAAVVFAALAGGASAPGVQAQTPVRTITPLPTATVIRLQSNVLVPDAGTVLVGGYSWLAVGRTEYGAPLIGKLPYVNRGFGNVGIGRELVTGQVSVTVRIIDLREEEFRQTGFRRP